MIGTEQQNIKNDNSTTVSNNHTNGKKEWYCIAVRYAKEDTEYKNEKIGNHLGDNSINFHHFEHWHEAKQMWKKIKAQCKLKYGRSSILLDCKKLMKLNQAGNSEGIKLCQGEAKKNGLYAGNLYSRVLVKKNDTHIFHHSIFYDYAHDYSYTYA